MIPKSRMLITSKHGGENRAAERLEVEDFVQPHVLDALGGFVAGEFEHLRDCSRRAKDRAG